jgi:hypothetical protein
VTTRAFGLKEVGDVWLVREVILLGTERLNPHIPNGGAPAGLTGVDLLPDAILFRMRSGSG